MLLIVNYANYVIGMPPIASDAPVMLPITSDAPHHDGGGHHLSL